MSNKAVPPTPRAVKGQRSKRTKIKRKNRQLRREKKGLVEAKSFIRHMLASFSRAHLRDADAKP